jgi:hypothetical protein
MAYIGHRCTCGHSDLNHTKDGTSQSLGGCTATCQKPCGPTPEPEVIPTFDLKAQPVERVIVPGEGLPSEGGGFVIRTCTCDACVALHEQLATAAA